MSSPHVLPDETVAHLDSDSEEPPLHLIFEVIDDVEPIGRRSDVLESVAEFNRLDPFYLFGHTARYRGRNITVVPPVGLTFPVSWSDSGITTAITTVLL